MLLSEVLEFRQNMTVFCSRVQFTQNWMAKQGVRSLKDQMLHVLSTLD